jgi:hypothetical protein
MAFLADSSDFFLDWQNESGGNAFRSALKGRKALPPDSLAALIFRVISPEIGADQST